MIPQIRILYSCDPCKLKKVSVEVPARAEEDLNLWVEHLIRLLAHDHRKRSPYCPATQLSEVFIPILGAQKIGGPPVQ